jgi:hypothetical protein
MYDVSPDGRQFVIAGGPDGADRLIVTVDALGGQR